jgi:hypothetical protein
VLVRPIDTDTYGAPATASGVRGVAALPPWQQSLRTIVGARASTSEPAGGDLIGARATASARASGSEPAGIGNQP